MPWLHAVYALALAMLVFCGLDGLIVADSLAGALAAGLGGHRQLRLTLQWSNRLRSADRPLRRIAMPVGSGRIGATGGGRLPAEQNG